MTIDLKHGPNAGSAMGHSLRRWSIHRGTWHHYLDLSGQTAVAAYFLNCVVTAVCHWSAVQGDIGLTA